MISIITGTIGLLVAALIILLIRKDRMHTHHGLGWVITASAFALLGFSPKVFDQIAQYIGIAYPPVLALTLGIVLLVIKILLMDIESSRIEIRSQRLIQRVAMLEADLRETQKMAETLPPTHPSGQVVAVGTEQVTPQASRSLVNQST